MTWQDVLASVIYPFIVLVVPALGAWAVVELRGMAATAQSVADAAALSAALARGKALAIAGGVSAENTPQAIVDYLHVTSPELAQRTGMAPEGLGVALDMKSAAAVRIAATIATPEPVKP